MKEMTPCWNDRHWEQLWSGPIQHARQGDSVVLFAMDHQGLFVCIQRQCRCRKFRNCRANQNGFLHPTSGPQIIQGLACHKGAKRKTSQCQGAIGCDLVHQIQQVLRLANSVIVNTLTLPHAAKIETQAMPARLDKCARQGLHHFVVHGAAIKRMGVRHHSQTFGRGFRRVQYSLDTATSHLQIKHLRHFVQRPTLSGKRKRSTIWPFFKWLSMISSMSCWST